MKKRKYVTVNLKNDLYERISKKSKEKGLSIPAIIAIAFELLEKEDNN